MCCPVWLSDRSASAPRHLRGDPLPRRHRRFHSTSGARASHAIAVRGPSLACRYRMAARLWLQPRPIARKRHLPDRLVHAKSACARECYWSKHEDPPREIRSNYHDACSGAGFKDVTVRCCRSSRMDYERCSSPSRIVRNPERLLSKLQTATSMTRVRWCQTLGNEELDSVGQSPYRHGYILPVLQVTRRGNGHCPRTESHLPCRRSAAMFCCCGRATCAKKHRSQRYESVTLAQQ